MPTNKTVLEIVKDYLSSNGYGGLFNEDADCGCQLSDLSPCDSPCMDCEAGYKVACSDACRDAHELQPHGWHIQREKPAAVVAPSLNPPGYDDDGR